MAEYRYRGPNESYSYLWSPPPLIFFLCVKSLHSSIKIQSNSKDTANPSSHHVMAFSKRVSFTQALAPKKYPEQSNDI